MTHLDIVWMNCAVHGRVAMSDAQIRQMIIAPICPKADPNGRMGVCGRKLWWRPVDREPTHEAWLVDQEPTDGC